MCASCWEGYGRPTHTSPAIERAVELTKRLYQTATTGGPLHIATDDWNLEDSAIQFCREEAARWEDDGPTDDFPATKATAVELADLLASMPLVDRAAAMARVDGFV